MDNKKANDLENVFGPVIYSYSRAQAIKDGCLWDITEQAKSEGVKLPTCLSQGVYNLCDEAATKGGKDLKGVVSDILLMFKLAARQSQSDKIWFDVLIWSPETARDKLYKLRAICGPGDTAAPVITIMLTTED